MASSGIHQQPLLSTVNAVNFVPIKLRFDEKGTNYRAWVEQMSCLIDSQGLLGFIDGTKPPPPQRNEAAGKNQRHYLWRRTDILLRGWILCSLSDDIVSCVSAFKTSREIFLELHRISQLYFNSAPISDRSAETDRDYMQEDVDYLPLDRAVQQGNWFAAKAILDHHPLSSATNAFRRKALLRAAGTRKANHIVEELVEEMPSECITSLDAHGNTPLTIAAALGNIQLAKSLATKHPGLLYIKNKYGNLPIHMAAINAERDMLEYLICVTLEYFRVNPYTGVLGLRLLLQVIDAEFLDIALRLVVKHPELATLTLPDGYSALQNISSKKSIFCAKRRFTLGERIILSCVSLDTTLRPQFTTGCDIESLTHNGQAAFQRLQVVLGRFVEGLGPIKSIKKKILLKQQPLELVKCLCKEIESLGYVAASYIYMNACMTAAELGIHEVVEEIIKVFPGVVYAPIPDSKKPLLHLAVENRSEHVYNLICLVAEYGDAFSGIQDFHGNNLLHLAGKLAPPHKLDEIPGAALQMQHELQWYKEVEKLVNPRAREQLNKAWKSPKMVFTEEHKHLKEAGEKWMKDTANSCTFAAALIATVMFAASITVPGGSDNSKGFPIFSSNAAFVVFAISDAISLFTSVTSLLMFLAILTSRYAEEDFLYVLPTRLIIGLCTLFLSITSMMAAFSATIYLVFGQKKAWVLIPVGGLACLPVASFAFLQFPLLFDLISSTCGSGIFSKKQNG